MKTHLINSFSNPFIVFLLVLINCQSAFTQGRTIWDDNSTTIWPNEAEIIEITSSIDENIQKSYLFRSKSETKRPLIVSLHTWSGDFKQKDPILKYCIAADVHYIHPDFRGPNNRPQAAGSPLAIQDINDAIQWALDSLQIDENEIHILGVSGGALASVLTYMKSKHPIASVHAFVGMYNLEDWFYESKGRKNAYADHILTITSGYKTPHVKEARNRSPYFMQTPVNLRQNSRIILYCGLHDGYTGSVPISQTLEMYNKLIHDFDPSENTMKIPFQDIYTLLKRRHSPNFQVVKYGFMGRDLIYKKNYQDKIQVIVFDGGHEMPDGNMLKLIWED